MKLTSRVREVYRALRQNGWQSWSARVGVIAAGTSETADQMDDFTINRAVYIRIRDSIFFTVSFTCDATQNVAQLGIEVPFTPAKELQAVGTGRRTSGGGQQQSLRVLDSSHPVDIDFISMEQFNGAGLSLTSGDRFTVTGSYLV